MGKKKKGQKNATPSREQAAVMRAAGLSERLWVVLEDLQHGMIVKQRYSGEVRMISKATKVARIGSRVLPS